MVYTKRNSNKVFIDFQAVKTIEHRNENEISITWLTKHDTHYYVLDDKSLEKIFEDIEAYKKGNI